MIAPVFTYRWQAALFVLFMAVFATLPFLDKPDWMDRSVLYRSISFGDRTRNNILGDLLKSHDYIDVLFLGSSGLGSGFNPVLLRLAMKAALGHDVNVVMAYHNKQGFDFDYVLLKDILDNHRVKLLVWEGMHPPEGKDPQMHYRLDYLLDYHKHEELARMAPSQQKHIYLASSMNGLKLLLSPLLHYGPMLLEQGDDFICNRAFYYGACLREEARQGAKPFPPPPKLDMEQILHFRGDSEIFVEKNTFRDYDMRMLKLVLRLAMQSDTDVALAMVPSRDDPYDALPGYTVPYGELGWNIPIVGARLEDLLKDSGLKSSDMYEADNRHFVYNATNYYTKTVLPALIEVLRQVEEGGVYMPPMDEVEE
ncbi:MAG: hypothetical protein K2Q01_03255 [Rickettsiales bacterium]|nr:hypothetical protein [Rickettsiales bacterium]